VPFIEVAIAFDWRVRVDAVDAEKFFTQTHLGSMFMQHSISDRIRFVHFFSLGRLAQIVTNKNSSVSMVRTHSIGLLPGFFAAGLRGGF
jgi:hypothetical protein